MSAPSNPCSTLREEHLLLDEHCQAPSALEQHAQECDACGAWLQRHERLLGVLGAVGRYPAPVDLESGVVDELISGASRLAENILELPAYSIGEHGEAELAAPLQRALAGLAVQPAPSELDRRLAQDLEGSPVLRRTVGRLERVSAPSVLERLVDEELRDPAAVTRRMAGSLPRQSGPGQLASNVEHALGEGPARRTRILPLRWSGGVSAAALLILAGTWLAGDRGADVTPRLMIVEVQSLESLDPLAADLLAGMTGRTTLESSGDEEAEL